MLFLCDPVSVWHHLRDVVKNHKKIRCGSIFAISFMKIYIFNELRNTVIIHNDYS